MPTHKSLTTTCLQWHIKRRISEQHSVPPSNSWPSWCMTRQMRPHQYHGPLQPHALTTCCICNTSSYLSVTDTSYVWLHPCSPICPHQHICAPVGWQGCAISAWGGKKSKRHHSIAGFMPHPPIGGLGGAPKGPTGEKFSNKVKYYNSWNMCSSCRYINRRNNDEDTLHDLMVFSGIALIWLQ